LLETGVLLKDRKCIDAVLRTSSELLNFVGPDGKMPGRFDKNWNPTVSWACLTGMAQISIVWRCLFLLTKESKFEKASSKVNSYLKSTQYISEVNPGMRGGIKGSHPINGGYGKYRILNWATKFFIDSLMLEEYSDLTFPLY
jgi:hypothetical protein